MKGSNRSLDICIYIAIHIYRLISCRRANVLAWMKKLTIGLICFIGIALISYVIISLCFSGKWKKGGKGILHTSLTIHSKLATNPIIHHTYIYIYVLHDNMLHTSFACLIRCPRHLATCQPCNLATSLPPSTCCTK